MKVIELKLNDKLVLCQQVKEITIKEFSDKQKEIEKTWQEKDEKILLLQNEVSLLKSHQNELDSQIADLYHQIAVDRGEEE